MEVVISKLQDELDKIVGSGSIKAKGQVGKSVVQAKVREAELHKKLRSMARTEAELR